MAWIVYYSILLLTLYTASVRCDENTTNYAQTFDKTIDKKYVAKVNFDGFCDINENCTHSQVCLDGHCRCRPDHRWDEDRAECRSYNCADDTSGECGKYDRNRRCEHNLAVSLFGSKCECLSGYYEDKRNFKCRQFCFNNGDCDRLAAGMTQNQSNHRVCVDFLCQCRPNYRFDATAQACLAFNCTKDSDCWTNGDENRECIEGVCECNFQEDSESTKCYLSLYSLFRIKNYTTRKEGLLLCTIFIIPSIAIYCLYNEAKKRRIKRLLRQRIMEKNQMNINYLYLTKNQELKDVPQKS